MRLPTSQEREEQLLLLLFGAVPTSALGRCVRRAYRNLNRTLHGIGSHASNQPLQQEAPALLESRLSGLLGGSSVESQAAYDAWHEHVIQELRALYSNNGFTSFSVGQGQKWINMALKYAVIFGEERISGTSRLFKWLHVPIDNIILDEVRALRGPVPTTAWSRLQKYPEYLAVQTWFRTSVEIQARYPEAAPLAVEFHLWESGMRKAGG